MIALDAARAAVIAACAPLGAETVPLAAALGRTLARTLHASDDLVPFARSAMDGYAVRAADVRLVPADLPVLARVRAAPGAARAHVPFGAVAIATGGALPLGADAVVPIEETTAVGDAIRVHEPVAPGDHVFPPGDDARRGDVLVRAGTALEPGALALLAAAGVAAVDVHRRPRVAVVATGDELVGVDAAPGFGQIRDSNTTLLAALAARLGADVVMVERAADAAASLDAALARAIAAADVVVTSGGASVGERDLTKAALRALGAAFLFESVAMRPGRPTAAARAGDALVLVLPGNPAAAFTAAHALLRPALAVLGGSPATAMPRVRARLEGDALHGKAARDYLPFVRLAFDARGAVARPLVNQCSALSRTAAEANGFAALPPGARDYVPGDAIDVDVYDWASVAAVPLGAR